MSEMTDVIVDVLTEARHLIATPEQWTQGAYSRGRTNRPTKIESSRAVKFCIEGACERAASVTGHFGYLYVVRKLADDLGLPRDDSGEVVGTLADWQDEPGRTHADVLSLIDRALVRRLPDRSDEQ